MLKIYHYSDKDFKGYIKPSFFGLNEYSKNSQRISDIKRSFFYLGKGKEYFLNGSKFCYIAEIAKSKLFDLTDYSEKNYKKIRGYPDIYKRIKFLGYEGVRGNNGFDVVCLFKPIKYIDKRYLTKA